MSEDGAAAEARGRQNELFCELFALPSALLSVVVMKFAVEIVAFVCDIGINLKDDLLIFVLTRTQSFQEISIHDLSYTERLSHPCPRDYGFNGTSRPLLTPQN